MEVLTKWNSLLVLQEILHIQGCSWQPILAHPWCANWHNDGIVDFTISRAFVWYAYSHISSFPSTLITHFILRYRFSNFSSNQWKDLPPETEVFVTHVNFFVEETFPLTHIVFDPPWKGIWYVRSIFPKLVIIDIPSAYSNARMRVPTHASVPQCARAWLHMCVR